MPVTSLPSVTHLADCLLDSSVVEDIKEKWREVRAKLSLKTPAIGFLAHAPKDSASLADEILDNGATKPRGHAGHDYASLVASAHSSVSNTTKVQWSVAIVLVSQI